MSRPQSEPSAIGSRELLIRFGALGDLVQLTSALQFLERILRDEVDVLAGTGLPTQVFAGLSSVGDLMGLESRRTPYWLSPEQRRQVQRLRERPPERVFLLEPRPTPARKLRWLLHRSGVPDRAIIEGTEAQRRPLEHTIDFQHRILKEAIDDPVPEREGDPPPPRLVVTEAEHADCLRWLRARGWTDEPIVVLQTLSRRANRGRWSTGKWLETMQEILRERPEARIVLSGTPAERAEIQELAKAATDPRIWPAADDLPLRRLLALLTVATSCISLDTGPAHAAATLGCPLVVLLGMADPRRCSPRSCGADVRLVASIPEEQWPNDPVAWQTLQRTDDIPVDRVVEAWCSLEPRAAPDQEETR